MSRKFKPTDLEALVEEFNDYEFLPDYGGPYHPALLPRDQMSEVWRPALEKSVSDAWGNLMELRGICKSPIEERFLAALWSITGWGCTDKTALDDTGSAVAWQHDSTAHDHLTIHAQAPVGPYHADFLLSLRIKKGVFLHAPEGVVTQVAIELDGHDFHEKTKVQAAKDKKRDRFFTTSGLTFLRFTGSEVFRDSLACANEALELLNKNVRKQLEQSK